MASLGHVAVGMAGGRFFTNDAEDPKAWRRGAFWFSVLSRYGLYLLLVELLMFAPSWIEGISPRRSRKS